MKRNLLFTASVILIAIFISCQKADDLTDSPTHLSVSIYQTPDSGGSKLNITFSGGRYDCANVEMYNTVTMGPGTIAINIGDNYLPNNKCAPFSTPGDHAGAQAFISLGHLNNGNYSLTVSHNHSKGKGTISVTNETFTISLSGSHFSFFQNKTKLNRIPVDALYGKFFSYTNDSINQVLFDTLSYYGAIEYDQFLPIGDYGYFSIDNNHKLFHDGFYNWDFLYKVNIDSISLVNIRNFFHQSSSQNTPYFYSGKGFRVGI